MEILIAVLCFLVIYLGQTVIYRKYWDQGLSLDLDFDDRYLEIGDKSGITETITNRKMLPLTTLHVKFSTARSLQFQENENAVVTDFYHRNDPFSIMGNRKVVRKLSFTAKERGLFFISAVKLMAKDFLMSKTFALSVENQAYLYVFPEKLSNIQLDTVLDGMLGDLTSRRSLFPDPFAFSGLRTYSVGDPRKSINWKATARCDDLMVNVYEHTAEQRVKILVCLEPNTMIRVHYIQEMCISIASTAASYFLDNRIPVMIRANGYDLLSGEVEWVDFGSSGEHRFTVDKYLARITESAGIDRFFEVLKQEVTDVDSNTTYLIVSAYHKKDLLNELDHMAEKGKNIYMIVPYLNIQGCDDIRPYLHGMEVELNDT